MSETLGPTGSHSRARLNVLGLVVLASSLAGCASVSQDVDAYYRQMAYNYKEAEEKARMEAITLENETKVLATTGDFSKLKASSAELEPGQGVGREMREGVEAIREGRRVDGSALSSGKAADC